MLDALLVCPTQTNVFLREGRAPKVISLKVHVAGVRGEDRHWFIYALSPHLPPAPVILLCLKI